ncbi:MAG: hypothetical protein ABI716_01085, partial [Candidatus Saccharibacteria bacterium]
MIRRAFEIGGRFYSYQKTRFPIVILAISLLPAILSSGAIVATHPTIITAAMLLLASIAYLLHIRIADDYRDFEHDNIYHLDRPLQTGQITKADLRAIDVLAVLILLTIAAVSGFTAFIIALIMLVYSYLAGNEFFFKNKIKPYFFIYNSLNLLQMLLMQAFVYTIFARHFPLTDLVTLHFVFTTIGTIIFEFIRKLKIPGNDGLGKDTYSWHLGFRKAMIIYLGLALASVMVFDRLANLISNQSASWLLLAAILATILTVFAAVHLIRK